VGVVHPLTRHVRANRPFPALRPPVVVKPASEGRTSIAAMTRVRCKRRHEFAETPNPSQALVQNWCHRAATTCGSRRRRADGAVYRVAAAGSGGRT
jgi:hypothetical protein